MNILIRLLLFFSLCSGSAFAQTAGLMPNAVQQFFDNNGNPLASGTVTTYVVGTTTLKTTWQDAAETIPNTNPIVLNAAGRAIIYGDGNYRQVVRDRLGNIIWDAVTSAFGTGGTSQIGDGNAVGTVLPWSGLVAPTRYVFAYGQELSRTTYSQLYTTVTLNTTISCASGSPIITGFSDTTQIPIGANVEASCVAAGTTVLSKTSSTITVSNNANATSSVSLRVFPWGNGNGTTTFNVPDLRGRYLAGRDNMGGTAASRLTNVYYGESADALGANGGFQYNFLATTNLPAYTPAGTIVVTDTHKHFIAANEDINTGTPTNSNASSQIPSRNTFAANVGFNLSNTGTAATVGLTSVTGAGSITSAFTGTAQGGAATPFAIIPPSLTFNYIIKILPDVTISTLNVVTSIQGMVGDLTCVAPVSCTGQVISATGAGSGDVVGPVLSTDNGLVLFDGITGKIIKDNLYAFPGEIWITALAGGTPNAILLVAAPSLASLTTGNTVRFQAASTNTGPATARYNLSTPPYPIYKDGPSGPSVLTGNEIIANNWYTIGFDSTLNGATGGWRLVPGHGSSAAIPANCAPYIPFNPPFQSGATLAEGGATGGSGIFTDAGGFQTACLRGSLEFFPIDQFSITSPDPTGVITYSVTPGDWNISAVSNAAGLIRLTVTSTAGLSNGNQVGVSNSYNTDKTASAANGTWTLSNVTATTVDLVGSTFDITKTYSASPRAGFISTGALDINPAFGCYRYVPLRQVQFNDAPCLYSIGTTTTQTPSAAQLYFGYQHFVVDPDMTAIGPHGVVFIGGVGISDSGGARSLFPSLGIARGIFTADVGRLCGGGINSNLKVGLLQCDKGAGTISANIGYWSNNQPIGQPIADTTKGLIIKNNTGTPTTKIDIFLISATLQGPIAGAGGTNTILRQTTTVYSETASLYQTIDTAATGINGMRAADFPLASGSVYYVMLLKNYLTGATGGFLTTSLDPSTFPASPAGYVGGYYAVLGQIKTKPALATFDTYLIENGIAQYTITGNETLATVHCSTQNFRTQVLAGGGANNTLTIGVVGNYLDNCEIPVTNTDPSNYKLLSVNGLATTTSYVVPASGSATVQRVGANWIVKGNVNRNSLAFQDGGQTVAVGQTNLGLNTTASIFATAVGYQALNALTTGIENSAFGWGALQSNTTGASNTAVGLAALFVNTTGSNNVAVGRSALGANTTGSNNMAIGIFALASNTTSGGNTAIGTQALNSSVTGTENVAIGTSALFAANGSADNTAVGYNSLIAVTTGQTNTALGARSGISLTSGSNNIVIGYNLNLASNTASNQLNIGDLIWGVGLSGSNAGCIAIGATSCTNKLEVTGAVRTVPVAVASLPTCTGAQGSRHFVTDSTQTLTAGIGAVVVGGAGNPVPVVCDGTNWRIG